VAFQQKVRTLQKPVAGGYRFDSASGSPDRRIVAYSDPKALPEHTTG